MRARQLVLGNVPEPLSSGFSNSSPTATLNVLACSLSQEKSWGALDKPSFLEGLHKSANLLLAPSGYPGHYWRARQTGGKEEGDVTRTAEELC